MPLSDHGHRLIAQGSRFAPTYGDDFANHLPMALAALAAMGADAERLDAYFEQESRWLQPQPEVTPGPTLLGQPDHQPHWLHHFRQQIAQGGVTETLGLALPALLPGIASGAFHPLIRLGFALDFGNDDEVAQALAYWASHYQALGPLGAACDLPLAAIAAAAEQALAGQSYPQANISRQLCAASRDLAALGLAVQPRDLTQGMLADFAIRAYLGSGDFTLLHGVTGCHALRLVLPHMADDALALRYFWQGLLLAWLTSAPAGHRPLAVADDRDWPALFAVASKSDDDHLIKLVYSCHQEHLHHGNPAYLAAARGTVLAKEQR
ncbi:questin oxidase family protein [Gallaecimonas sp. GXIMD4217]|uniref:questin oxidase family protein n=1 Tax=Gallaecimonas sp. GXIMD4217 TaxID=3131927 RepID=UPI00311B1FBA